VIKKGGKIMNMETVYPDPEWGDEYVPGNRDFTPDDLQFEWLSTLKSQVTGQDIYDILTRKDYSIRKSFRMALKLLDLDEELYTWNKTTHPQCQDGSDIAFQFGQVGDPYTPTIARILTPTGSFITVACYGDLVERVDEIIEQANRRALSETLWMRADDEGILQGPQLVDLFPGEPALHTTCRVMELIRARNLPDWNW
jgi:hypothetical protein